MEAYAKAQGLWRINGAPAADYTDVVELDLSTVEPSLAGPKRPQDRVPLTKAKSVYQSSVKKMAEERAQKNPKATGSAPAKVGDAEFRGQGWRSADRGDHQLHQYLESRRAGGRGTAGAQCAEAGPRVKPWVKTSLAPGSRVVTDYLTKAGLLQDLEQLGFYTVGYGCTTCIGNSGPLKPEISEAVKAGDVVACSVLSGNRNFEGRVHPEIKMNFLASPPLVVAYALAGSLDIDITTEPFGTGKDGKPVYLKDIWPSAKDVAAAVGASVDSAMFKKGYANVFVGDANWAAIKTPGGKDLFLGWEIHLREESALLRRHDDDAGADGRHQGRTRARGAGRFGHHGSHLAGRQHLENQPRRQIPHGPGRAGRGFQFLWRAPRQSRSHDARHVRQYPLAQLAVARHRRRRHAAHSRAASRCRFSTPSMKYKAANTPLVILAGKEYGTGSSRDWAAKGTMLLGVKAVIAESFERIHRSNLIGMGVLPLQFKDGQNAQSLGLTGKESFEIVGLNRGAAKTVKVIAKIRCRQNHRVRGASAHRYAEGTRLLPARRDSAVRAASARGAGQGGLGDYRLDLRTRAAGTPAIRAAARPPARCRPRPRTIALGLMCALIAALT